MLTEIKTVNQEPDAPRRRWFSGPALDLYVWYDDDDNIVQFQICYNKGPGEQALTWRADRDLAHHAVDDGEGGVFRMRSSPIMTRGEDYNVAAVREEFVQSGQKLEHDLYEFILARLGDA